MKSYFFCLILIFCILPNKVNASPITLTYQYKEKIYTVRRDSSWKEIVNSTYFRGEEIQLKDTANLPEGVTLETQERWNNSAIAEALRKMLSKEIDREAGTVRIYRDESNTIAFDGVGLTGLRVDIPLAVSMTMRALDENVPLIQVPVIETEPTISIEDTELINMGIREVVTIGESNYEGSPKNRVHNIGVGLSKFDGSIVKPKEEFSFNAILGPVNGATGYLKELTIFEDRTIPDYGGGLCQVSTTAYRGVWNAGFPITSHRNHSYAVRYYAPSGTDATIYPPHTDMRFLNDTDSHLLIQTYAHANRAYFIFYGTRRNDGKKTELVGPFTWDTVSPPEDRTGYTTDIPPGEKRIVGKAVPGMKTLWYRILTDTKGTEVVEPYFSQYEARPNFEEIGVESLDGLPQLSLSENGDQSEEADSYDMESNDFDASHPRRALLRVRIRR